MDNLRAIYIKIRVTSIKYTSIMITAVALPLGVWLLSTSALGAVAMFSIPKSKHERSMMMMGIGIPILGAFFVQIVSSVWLFFASLSAGVLGVGMAFKAASVMTIITGAFFGIVFR